MTEKGGGSQKESGLETSGPRRVLLNYDTDQKCTLAQPNQ